MVEAFADLDPRPGHAPTRPATNTTPASSNRSARKCARSSRPLKIVFSLVHQRRALGSRQVPPRLRRMVVQIMFAAECLCALRRNRAIASQYHGAPGDCGGKVNTPGPSHAIRTPRVRTRHADIVASVAAFPGAISCPLSIFEGIGLRQASHRTIPLADCVQRMRSAPTKRGSTSLCYRSWSLSGIHQRLFMSPPCFGVAGVAPLIEPDRGAGWGHPPLGRLPRTRPHCRA